MVRQWRYAEQQSRPLGTGAVGSVAGANQMPMGMPTAAWVAIAHREGLRFEETVHLQWHPSPHFCEQLKGQFSSTRAVHLSPLVPLQRAYFFYQSQHLWHPNAALQVY